MGKVWKNGSDEDKFIAKLIKKGKINKYTKPKTLKQEYPGMFGLFTDNVIRNHLNLLKRSNGLFLDGESEEENDEVIDVDAPRNEAVAVVVDDDRPAETSGLINNGFNNIFHRNYPIVCEVYKDPENQCQKVSLVITMPAGAQNVKIEVSDNGATSVIKYQWSKTMFDMDDLYKKLLDANHINKHHPRILAVKNGLEKYRQCIDAAPEATITVTLPIKVQTASGSWSKFGVHRQDGTQILVVDFTGYVKNYNKKLTDAAVIFD